VIHNDFERGFIRAETVSYENLVECGSELEAKKRGLMRSEGKDYVVQEDDVILFRFNV
jgi:ribosome-binding ATPase YchF (GTP1/OBG family)